jgi:hypothetical protein
MSSAFSAFPNTLEAVIAIIAIDMMAQFLIIDTTLHGLDMCQIEKIDSIADYMEVLWEVIFTVLGREYTSKIL